MAKLSISLCACVLHDVLTICVFLLHITYAFSMPSTFPPKLQSEGWEKRLINGYKSFVIRKMRGSGDAALLVQCFPSMVKATAQHLRRGNTRIRSSRWPSAAQLVPAQSWLQATLSQNKQTKSENQQTAKSKWSGLSCVNLTHKLELSERRKP